MFFKLCLQVELDDFVDSLYLAVSLGMIDGIEAFLDPKIVAEHTKIFVVKLRSII